MPRLLLSISLALLLALTACKHKSDEPSSKIPPDATYDFVTVEASGTQGCVLTLRKVDDEPLVRYTSNYDLASSSTHISVGDRVIICYKPYNGKVYTSGHITLYGYATLDNTEQLLQVSEYPVSSDWDANPLKVDAIWRTGQYINLQGEIYVTYAQKPKEFVLTVDWATMYDEIPCLYMSYVNQDGNDGDNPYDTDASFDISPVWSLLSCQGVKVCVPTHNGIVSYTFLKSPKQ